MSHRAVRCTAVLGIVPALFVLALAPRASATALYDALVAGSIGFSDPDVELLNVQTSLDASAHHTPATAVAVGSATGNPDPAALSVEAAVFGNTAGAPSEATSSATAELTFDLHNLTDTTIFVALDVSFAFEWLGTVDDPALEFARVALTHVVTGGGLSAPSSLNVQTPPNFFDAVSGFFRVSPIEIGPDGTVPVSLRVTAFGLAQAVPAPTPLVLISLGGAGLVALRRRLPPRAG